jgi:hypothetical protein
MRVDFDEIGRQIMANVLKGGMDGSWSGYLSEI